MDNIRFEDATLESEFIMISLRADVSKCNIELAFKDRRRPYAKLPRIRACIVYFSIGVPR